MASFELDDIAVASAADYARPVKRAR